MKKSNPMNLVVYYPQTQEGRQALARRVAEVHANTVEMRIKRLTCPAPQKLQLLDAIIADARLKRLAKTKEATYDKDTVPERYD